MRVSVLLPTPPPVGTDELIIFAPRTPSSPWKQIHAAEPRVCACARARTGRRSSPWSSASELFIVKMMGIKRGELCRGDDSQEQ